MNLDAEPPALPPARAENEEGSPPRLDRRMRDAADESGPRRRILLLGFVLIAVGSCAHEPRGLPFYRGPDLTPEWIAQDSPEYAAIHRVADFALTDQHGETVTARELNGRVTVASFFFTSCGQICPTLRSSLARVRDAFAGDTAVLLLSHTVVPEADSVGALAAYAHRHGIHGRQWRLLTGGREEIRRLARESYFVELDDPGGNTAGNLVHTETLVLLDAGRRIRGVYDGTLPYDVAQLIEDVRALEEEQSRSGEP
ncbi:MAG TPA: SCO family protein [Longimicrobium sp.]|jgi:protein SCO1/2